MKRFWIWFGDLKQIVGQLGIYVSIYSILATSLLLWRIVIKPLLDEYRLNIGPEWFIAIGVVILVGLGAIERKHGLPGYYESAYKFSPIYKDMEQLKADNIELRHKLDQLIVAKRDETNVD